MRKAIVSLIVAALICVSPIAAAAQSGRGDVLIKNATVLTASRGTLQNTDILVQNGKIARIGRNITAPAGVKVIDATGKFVTPGVIDAHSHTMVSAINEGSLAVTSMTKIREMLNPTDLSIYRGLAGGVTTALVLHGSANPIGGQSSTVKFKFGRPVEEFPIADAPPGIKFALGENVKRSNFQPQPGQTPRYPRTRMGTMEVIRDAFIRAREYKQAWDDYRAKKTRTQPRVDEELAPLVEVLEGKRKVHCHGYRSDEHLNMLRLAEEFGFRIGTLQHALEAYKIAPEIAKHGAGASIFADFWSYKLEAYDSIPYNAYILWKNGVVVSINSDSNERMRRLNLDAAKMMKYGGVPEQDALQMITLNPAKHLGIDKRTGSIETGKDGDLVIWSEHPFSVYTVAETTIIEGDVYFDRAQDKANRAALAAERAELEKLDQNKAPGSGGTSPRVPAERVRGDLDDADGDGGN
jgi:imidazolonepropionase-like amidohydrolase